jgi:long-chain acyl-CoA synthetase
MNELFDCLEQRARTAPQDLLLHGAAGACRVREAMATLERLVAQLDASGVRRLALIADNSPAWALVDIAAQMAGLVLVPIPTWFTAAQRAWVMEAAGVDGICCDSAGSNATLEDSAGARPLLGGLLMIRRAVAAPPALPRETAKITFTSGSTGQPRGVCLSTAHCLQVVKSLLERTGLVHVRHLVMLPLATLLENLAGLYLPIVAGGTVLLPGPDELGLSGSSGLDPGRMLECLSRRQPESLILVPELLRVLVAATERGWAPPSSLRFIAVGGARVAPPLVGRARAAGLPVYEGYGLSECASVVALNAPGGDYPGTSGQLLPHVRGRVVEGELRISGSAFLGYLDEPGSWYQDEVATGDLVELSETGVVTVAGRRKNLLVTAFGRNINPEWVESELLASGGVMQAVVFGDGRPACVGLLCPLDPAAGDELLCAAVRAANARLPDYARLAAWRRLDSPLDTQSGLLTGNGRPRRHLIAGHYRKLIDAMYSELEVHAL